MYKDLPRNSKIYFNIAILHMNRHSYRKAIISLQKSLDMEKSAIGLFLMACLYKKSAEHEIANDYFEYCLNVMRSEQIDYSYQGLKFILTRKMVENEEIPSNFALFFPEPEQGNFGAYRSERELWQQPGPMPAFI